MHFCDWLILALVLMLVLAVGVFAQGYMKSVADFMSGGRLAGRYLLAVARGEMGCGAVVFVWAFERIGQSGFILTWWESISVPVSLIMIISGFVTYRYRETRAMTLAQFFEIRYSKSFRVFAGILGFLAGILNFGIIPAVGSRCLIYFLGFPATISLWSHRIPTYIPLMACLLTATVLLTLSGGLVTLMITDCLEGILSQVFFVIIIFALLAMFGWSQINHVMMDRPAGHSMLNPLDSQGNDFNLTLVLMTVCTAIYGRMAWQNASAYNSAAITPHESRMGGLLGYWRELGKTAVVVLLAVCAMTFLAHPDFAARSGHARELIGQIPQQQIRGQMRLPIAVSEMLPAGIRGLLCAVLMMGVFGGDSTHLHSWGGILVQDVLVPLRKKPFGPGEHIRALRLSIIAVALFAFLFGALFRQTEYVTMWFQVTTGVFVGGAGSAIIGGLYWKKGTAAGAWAAMITGAALSLTGILARQVLAKAFPFNGAQIFFTVSLVSITVYVVVSLLTWREDFNMDRMLHRGKYSSGESTGKSKVTWGRLIGMDENFTFGDKCIAWSVFGYGAFWFVMMLVGTLWYTISPWPIAVWSGFWHVFAVGVPVTICLATAVWFSWGGLRDIRLLFIRLKQERVDHRDDGTVIGHRNLDELESNSSVSAPAAEVRADGPEIREASASSQ